MALVVFLANKALGSSSFEKYAETILSMAPLGWVIAERHTNAVPEGFRNKKIKGTLYVFSGPKKVTWNWKAHNGEWNHEDLAYEALEIWIFPGNYRPGVKTYLKIKGPILPSKIYASKHVRVYAKPSHRLIVEKEIISKKAAEATMSYWDDSGEKDTISWMNWKDQIFDALQSAESDTK
jgi:hypothetical protein